MTICYFDACSGISGDMTVGALVDAGADTAALIEGLASLKTGATFHFEPVKRAGITARKFRVQGGEQKNHRHLPHILEMIAQGDLPEDAKKRATAVFSRLGEAESQVHGVPIERIHFHEIGAVDSICDIVGTSLALSLLGVERVYCSPLNTGHGTVDTVHGVLPVPAPATTRLLAGAPIYARGPRAEMTTPTGAALMAALGSGYGPAPAMVLRSSGCGAGDRDFEGHANVLRVMVGDAALGQ